VSDDLRTRAAALSYELLLLYPVKSRLISELVAEVDRLTAERDMWRKEAVNFGCHALRAKIKDGDEIDRLRNLAAALEAEVARAAERVAELESRAAYEATT